MSKRTVTELFDLSGRVALVTGATGHLGFEMATGLAEAGAAIVVASRSLGRANELLLRLPGVRDAEHSAIELDHMDGASITAGFGAAVKAAGKIDILVNNGHQATTKTWHDVSAEEFTQQLANATGYFLLAKAIRDHAVSRNAPASVIMLGSMYGIVSSNPDLYEGIGRGNPIAYQSLKGGVIQMARHLAVHWARDQIRVNTLSPGPFPVQGRAPEELCQRLAERTPLRRIGTADELK